MSLFAVSTTTASRHIRHQLLYNNASSSHLLLRIGGGGNIAAPARRNFATKGLRRPKNSGRPRATSPRATQSNASSSTSSSSSGGNSSPLQQQQYQRNSDPHSVANEMVNSSTTGRTSGVESVATLTTEQKLSNFAMATGLFGFVSYIFYYSLASVGGVENAKALLFGTSDDNTKQTEDGAPTPGFEEFLKEANEGRTLEEKRIKAETDARGEARELAALESSTAARLQAEGLGEDSVIVAGSATDEEEREMARVAGFVDGETEVKKRRPLWKRVVFFWRRD